MAHKKEKKMRAACLAGGLEAFSRDTVESLFSSVPDPQRFVESLLSYVPDPQRFVESLLSSAPGPDPQRFVMGSAEPLNYGSGSGFDGFQDSKKSGFSIFSLLTYLGHLDLHYLGIRWKDPDP
jgi:hypothetical protein